MTAFVQQLIEHFRWSDLLDIAIISCLLYLFITWLRDRATRSVGVVVLGLFLLFLLARWLDLYLTMLAFEYGVVVMLVVLAIVFQQDIRYGVERFATFAAWRRQSSDAESDAWLGTVTEAILRMAEGKIGALIVLPGREPLERHLRGGIDVDAKISLPLLLSIFDPNSPGHDGAILVEAGRIVALGLHLPLSNRVELIQDAGTRHAAALGLVERSDARVLVVSEERGTITLARAGALTILDPEQISKKIAEAIPRQAPNSAVTLATFSWGRSLASVCAATVLWLIFANTSLVVQRTFVVPIEYRDIPAGFEIVEPIATSAEVTLSGAEPAFQLLDLSSAMISIDASQTKPGRPSVFRVDEHLKRLPNDLEIEKVRPRSLVVSLQQKPTVK